MTTNETVKLNNIKKACENSDYELFQDETLMENAKIGAEHYKIDISRCTPTFVLKVDELFLAVIIQGCRKLDFKKLKKYLGTSRVRMATPEEILEITGAPVGSVSMINPDLRTLIDENVSNIDYCYGGCGVEKFTLKISSKDLIQITQAELGDFSIERF
jgi:prolyl-tRNA editing enzyme YbaK/EbsC (Cys-tRNA(Pro) deacylase)